MLDLQIQNHRARREAAEASGQQRRLLWLGGGLMVLVSGLVLAYVLMEWMAEQRPDKGAVPAATLSGE